MTMMDELRKRHILQIALLYLGAAWLFIEMAEFVVGEYGFSRKILDTVVLLAILGFPAFLVVGWYHGERGHQRVQRGELWLLLTLGVLAAVGTYRIATGEVADPAAQPAAESIAPAAAGPDASLASDTQRLSGPSLAVVPFTNNLTDDALDWLGPGVADLFTTNFAQLEWLRVVGRQRLYDLLTEEGRGEEEEIPEALASTVARAAGAEMMLWGTISGTAEDLVIDAQMIDVESGSVRAAERVRGSDVFALVDSLTTRLLDRLRPAPRPAADSRVRVSAMGTKDMDALAAFQRGISLERRGRVDEAFVEFERSVEMDSTFVLPALRLAGLASEARGYVFSDSGPVVVRTDAGIDSAVVAALRAGDTARAERAAAAHHRERAIAIVRKLGDRFEVDLQGLSPEDFVFRMDSTLERALRGLEAIAADSARRPPPPR